MKREEYISDSEVVRRAREAVRLELEKRKAMGLSSYVYDAKTRTIYRLKSDGSREVAEQL